MVSPEPSGSEQEPGDDQDERVQRERHGMDASVSCLP